MESKQFFETLVSGEESSNAYLQTLHDPPFFAQLLQYLQFLQALQLAPPLHVASMPAAMDFDEVRSLWDCVF